MTKALFNSLALSLAIAGSGALAQPDVNKLPASLCEVKPDGVVTLYYQFSHEATNDEGLFVPAFRSAAPLPKTSSWSFAGLFSPAAGEKGLGPGTYTVPAKEFDRKTETWSTRPATLSVEITKSDEQGSTGRCKASGSFAISAAINNIALEPVFEKRELRIPNWLSVRSIELHHYPDPALQNP